MSSTWDIIEGDCLEVMAGMDTESVQCCVTSPPYWGLRDYGVDGQLGLESTPDEYVAKMVEVFREVRRVLRPDGTCWLNLGDSYASSGAGNNGNEGYSDGRTNRTSRLGGKAVPNLKPKDLCMIPARVALALQADGWWLRQDIIWHKPNPMPESVTDRCTKAHEYVFLLTKSARYYYDAEAVKDDAATLPHSPGWATNMSDRKDRQVDNEANQRDWGKDGKVNKRSVWTIPTHSFPEAHFATFPPALVEPCVLAGSKEDDLVLDPFAGSGTVGMVASKMQRRFVGIELNPEYAEIARRRIGQAMPLFATSNEKG